MNYLRYRKINRNCVPHITYVPYSDTGYFSKLVTDYLGNSPQTSPFYTYRPDAEGIDQAIKDRQQYPVDRRLLADTLRKQYEGLPQHEVVAKNIDLLEKEDTFTICTAHQPNLLTGYLYFIYKILHAIKLADELNTQYPGKHFVPVYYMGSEDNDLEELGTFRYEGRKYVWDGNGQTGAVGRMDTASLKSLLDELFKVLGPPGDKLEELKEMLVKAYLNHKTIGKATQYLVNELFGRFGLVVLDPDEAGFKRAFTDVMKEDLLQHTAYSIVSAQVEEMEQHYKSQAHPRPVNLFYLEGQVRERIEQKGDKWVVVNTNISWTETELLKELEEHPERFSPNVILRGLFQETILPDVAFIGGGAEVAYWLQLKPLFEHHKGFFPVILLRQSVLWIPQQQAKLRMQLGFDTTGIFKDESLLVRDYIKANSTDSWSTETETADMERIMEQLKQKAVSLDPTLRASSEAVLVKIKHQLQVLEKKMLRAEKRKMHTQLLRIGKLKAAIFPNGSLQERVENFTGYYLQYGAGWLDVLKDAMEPLRHGFLVIEDE